MGCLAKFLSLLLPLIFLVTIIVVAFIISPLYGVLAILFVVLVVAGAIFGKIIEDKYGKF